MFAKDKVSQSMIDAVNKVLSEDTVDEASVKVPTKTGTMVYGGAKGGSAKAYLQQKYGDDLADVHGPSDKDLEAIKHEKKKKKEVDEEVEDVSEMDYGGGKNPYAGHGLRRDDDDGKKEFTAKAIKSKNITKTALDILNKKTEKDVKKEEVDEDFNIEDFSLEEIQEFMQTEDYEQLDELSKDILKRYIPTAAADLSKKGINAGIDAKSGKTGVTKDYGDHFQKRYRGILKATNKLAKEEVDEEVEGLDEMDKEQPGYDPRGYEDKPSFTQKERKKADKEWAKIDKKLGIPKRTGVESKTNMISDLTKHLNYHLQKAKVKKEEVELDEGKMGQLSADLKDLSHDDFHKEYGKPKSHYDPSNFKKPVQKGKEMDRAKSLAQRGMASMKKEEDTSFAYRLLQSIREGKGNQPQETFTDNNIGEAGVDPSIKTTDTLAGRKPGGKLNQHGPDPKIKLKSEEKEEDEGHEDEKEDKALIKKMVKKDCVKEEDVTEAMDTRADVPAFLRKQRGDKPLTPDEVKAKKPDTRSAPGNVKEAEEKEPPFAGPYTKSKDTVTDKSGAKHTPMSRVKDLARQSMKKVKNETLMGTAGATSESVEELDELNDKTVASYISKRMTGVLGGEYKRGQKDQEAKSRTGGFNPFDAKGYKEKEGLKRAASRLAKEEVEDLEEDAMLDVYLKSRGLNPATITTDKKIAYAKGSDFLRWKQNHS